MKLKLSHILIGVIAVPALAYGAYWGSAELQVRQEQAERDRRAERQRAWTAHRQSLVDRACQGAERVNLNDYFDPREIVGSRERSGGTGSRAVREGYEQSEYVTILDIREARGGSVPSLSAEVDLRIENPFDIALDMQAICRFEHWQYYRQASAQYRRLESFSGRAVGDVSIPANSTVTLTVDAQHLRGNLGAPRNVGIDRTRCELDYRRSSTGEQFLAFNADGTPHASCQDRLNMPRRAPTDWQP